MMNRFGFVGGGRITRIFLQAMKNKNYAVDTLVVSDPDIKTLEELTRDFSGLSVKAASNRDAASQDVVFLAVHPPVLKTVLPEIADDVSKAKAIVSLAPVFTSDKISGMLKGYNKLVRMIPNAASYLNSGYNPVWFSKYIGETEKNVLKGLFAVLGDCPQVEEEKLEAYAIVTAMGSTYLWPQLNELHKLAKNFGLSEEEAAAGMKAMVANTMELLYGAGLSYEQVVDLIPVKPLGEHEGQIRDMYRSKLSGLYNKLTGK
jgi:pyrroline-5-carboxylate reductase